MEILPSVDVSRTIADRTLDEVKLYLAVRESAAEHPRAKSFQARVPGWRISVERKEPGLLKLVNIEPA